MEFRITIDSEEFKEHTRIRVNYSHTIFSFPCFHIPNHPLLFEKDIKAQPLDCFECKPGKAFFKTPFGDHPFDIFAASFYLLSRYEEYLPHEKDSYGRYAHENSIAFKEGFLNLPLINIWVRDLSEALKEKYSTTNLQPQTFNLQPPTLTFQPTYDIDIAYSYKHKGLFRNIGGFLKSPSFERIKVLLGAKIDPFDSYSGLDNLHKKYQLKPIFFFLLAENKGKYDRNISPHKEAIWQLVKTLSKNYTVGLHPSWQSGDDPALLKKEKEQLEAMTVTGQAGNASRQHYIRFNLPGTYRQLINAGITDDYSMGYGSINGFRASVASTFYWFDLEKDEQTALGIHPFCFMDANSWYEQHDSPEKAFEELMHYLHSCKTCGGTLITIWHNNFLGSSREFKGWSEIYENFIAQVQQ